MNEKSLLTVIVPAFNEAENLEIVLPPLLQLCGVNQWKVILINDGSRDHTKRYLDSLPPSDTLTILHHKLNKGYGAAIKSGIEVCDTEFCITLDADGQHRPEDINRLFQELIASDADMMVGSRQPGKSRNTTRKIGKSIIRLLAKMLMNVPVKDINSGMKVYRTALAKKYMHLAPDTMAYSDIITLVFISNRELVLETPIEINPRLKGESTIRVQTAFQTIMEILNMVTLFNPAKIFLPLSALFLIMGIVIEIPVLLAGHGVSIGAMLAITAAILFFLLGLVAEQLSALRKNQ